MERLLELLCENARQTNADLAARLGIPEAEVSARMSCSVVGSPSAVRDGLLQFIEQAQVDEIIVVSAIYDHAAFRDVIHRMHGGEDYYHATVDAFVRRGTRVGSVRAFRPEPQSASPSQRPHQAFDKGDRECNGADSRWQHRDLDDRSQRISK